MGTATKVKPEHQVAEHPVAVPTVVATGLEFRDKKVESVFVQWFGEADGPNKLNGEQFFFDTGVGPNDPMWMDDPTSFQVVFIGPIKNWPNPDAIDQLMELANGNEDTNIVWLLSLKGLEPGQPSSPSMPIILLGDPYFGVIKPRPYCDMSVRDKVLAECKAGMSLADKLWQDPCMPLPPEEVPWKTEEGTCPRCESLEHSHQERPGMPSGGSFNDLAYVCNCGRRWWQYNDHFHLWKLVTDPAEWDAIRRQWILQRAGYKPCDDEG